MELYLLGSHGIKHALVSLTLQALKATDWLLSQQQADGGFLGQLSMAATCTTTSHASVALNLMDQAVSRSFSNTSLLTPTLTPTSTPTLTPRAYSYLTYSYSNTSLTPCPQLLLTLLLGSKDSRAPLPTPSPDQQPEDTSNQPLVTNDTNGLKSPSVSTPTSYIPTLAVILGIITLFAVIKIYELKKT